MFNSTARCRVGSKRQQRLDRTLPCYLLRTSEHGQISSRQQRKHGSQVSFGMVFLTILCECSISHSLRVISHIRGSLIPWYPRWIFVTITLSCLEASAPTSSLVLAMNIIWTYDRMVLGDLTICFATISLLYSSLIYCVSFIPTSPTYEDLPTLISVSVKLGQFREIKNSF